MSDFETWKMVWRANAWNPERRRDIIDAVCERGDTEALKWFWAESSWNPDYRAKIEKVLLKSDKATNRIQPLMEQNDITSFQYHAFICHATEDKENFVTPLAMRLTRHGVKVWYDKFTLKIGDSLRQKIDEGLKNSRYGIVVLSKAFFRKNWSQLELDGLFSREVNGKKVILPIWHGVSKDEVASYSPILSGKYAVLSSEGLDKVVNAILDVINE